MANAFAVFKMVEFNLRRISRVKTKVNVALKMKVV
jgi:hypothetical protein